MVGFKLSPTEMSSRLKDFQAGLGCVSTNLMAVMSCHGTELLELLMTKRSCEPFSRCGLGISCMFWMLTTQSDNDFEPVTEEGDKRDKKSIDEVYLVVNVFITGRSAKLHDN